jgi:hypothetical protein
MIARVITAIFPIMNSIEDIRNIAEKDVYDMLMNGLSTASEILTATQYLEGTRISARAHFERSLVGLEQRLSELLFEREGHVSKGLDTLEQFMDSLRKINVPPREMSFIPFLLWTMIVVLSYKQAKNLLLDIK